MFTSTKSDMIHTSYIYIVQTEPGARKKRAKCVFSYEPENDDELRLEVGDMVDVLKQVRYLYEQSFCNGTLG